MYILDNQKCYKQIYLEDYMGFISLFKKKEEVKLEPLTPKQRPACPFYGFFMGMDQEGNQCALIYDSYSPCPVEMKGQTPDWSKCPFNNEENKKALEEIADQSKVYPKEFRPKDINSWDGISLRAWMKYVMKEK